jgi:hypothetical protein
MQHLWKTNWTETKECNAAVARRKGYLFIRKTTGAFTRLDNVRNLLVREPVCGGKFLDEVPVEISGFAEPSPVETFSIPIPIRRFACSGI